MRQDTETAQPRNAMKILIKADLDAARCESPDCGHDHGVVYFHSDCHPSYGVDVRYDKALSHLTVLCHVCKRVVAKIAPAEQAGAGAAHQ